MFRKVKTVAAMYAYSRITEFDDAMYARSRVADLIDSVDLFRCFVFFRSSCFYFFYNRFLSVSRLLMEKGPYGKSNTKPKGYQQENSRRAVYVHIARFSGSVSHREPLRE